MALKIGDQVIATTDSGQEVAGVISDVVMRPSGDLAYIVKFRLGFTGCIYDLAGQPFAYFSRHRVRLAQPASAATKSAPPCAGCGEHNEYAQANRPDGNFVCWACRNGAEAWRWVEQPKAEKPQEYTGVSIFDCPFPFGSRP